MPRVLITAFEPYGGWQENASWSALVEFTRNLPRTPEVTTRLYPVDVDAVRARLEQDLRDGCDYAFHLGQAPGTSSIQLEAIGINVKSAGVMDANQPRALIAGAPVAYQSTLPLGRWAQVLRDAGIPARVSYHAGTFLCNATLFWTHYLCHRYAWTTRATFVHLPLSCEQVLSCDQEFPSLPSRIVAEAIRLILGQVV